MLSGWQQCWWRRHSLFSPQEWLQDTRKEAFIT